VHPQIAYGKHIDRTLLADAVHDLRNSYDYIVFDTAAVFESADPSSVCACSEAAVLVARAGRTRKADLKKAAEQLAPARMAGVVVVDT
jgi:Mrp family chromosome partitioning ATPase